jgi:hypothetical protein
MSRDDDAHEDANNANDAHSVSSASTHDDTH